MHRRARSVGEIGEGTGWQKFLDPGGTGLLQCKGVVRAREVTGRGRATRLGADTLEFERVLVVLVAALPIQEPLFFGWFQDLIREVVRFRDHMARGRVPCSTWCRISVSRPVQECGGHAALFVATLCRRTAGEGTCVLLLCCERKREPVVRCSFRARPRATAE